MSIVTSETATPEPAGSAAAAATPGTVLSVSDLTVALPTPAGWVRPVRGISFDLRHGQRLGLVGESGCGKSLTALALMRLLPAGGRIEAGRVVLDGVDLVALGEREMASVRGARIAMVTQNALAALDPIQTIGRQLGEAIGLGLGRHRSRRAVEERAAQLLDEVGIPSPRARLKSYPHELSGGMRQRVMIAMALSREPQILIADEATTALDVTTQARVLDLLDAVVAERRLAVVMITHDFGVAARFCDTVHVMYAGRIVEKNDAAGFFRDPAHPYSRGLLSSICRVSADISLRLPVIGGRPPVPQELTGGCAFVPRCPFAQPACGTTEPSPASVGAAVVECVRAGALPLEEAPDGW